MRSCNVHLGITVQFDKDVLYRWYNILLDSCTVRNRFTVPWLYSWYSDLIQSTAVQLYCTKSTVINYSILLYIFTVHMILWYITIHYCRALQWFTAQLCCTSVQWLAVYLLYILYTESPLYTTAQLYCTADRVLEDSTYGTVFYYSKLLYKCTVQSMQLVQWVTPAIVCRAWKCVGARARLTGRYWEILGSVLYCTVLNSTVLYCTVLYCTLLYCTLL